MTNEFTQSFCDTVLSRIIGTYAPNSSGPQPQLAAASLSVIDSFPALVAVCADRYRIFETTIDEFSRLTPPQAVQDFSDAFQKHGSDKSTTHDYHKLYATLLHARNAVRRLVEIGIGTNNPTIMSNMGKHAAPGASLRAFEALLPVADVIGADIDASILFQSGRVRCVRCDQTSDDGFNDLKLALNGEPVDVLIDDGLHAVNANLRSLLFGLDVVRPGGHVVIEDIPDRLGWFWKMLIPMFARRHECHLVRCRSALVFVLRV